MCGKEGRFGFFLKKKQINKYFYIRKLFQNCQFCITTLSTVLSSILHKKCLVLAQYFQIDLIFFSKKMYLSHVKPFHATKDLCLAICHQFDMRDKKVFTFMLFFCDHMRP